MDQNPFVMLLAAGLGTRLKALSDEIPKPMLPVCNYPLIRWVLDLCRSQGFDEFVINLHHLGEKIQKEIGDGSAYGAHAKYSSEEVILGTGGGIKAMARLMPRKTCVVLNSKIVVDIDLRALLRFHAEHGALATMVLHPDPQAEKWGAITPDENGQIIRLLDHRRSGEKPGPDCMFTGIHVLEPEFIDLLPEGPSCVIRTAYTEQFKRGERLAGFVHTGYFQEHSTPERYLEGNFNVLSGAVRLNYGPPALCGVHPSATIHPSASIVSPVLVGPSAKIGADARVGPCVVIGSRSKVNAGVTLDHSVVWSDAVASQSGSSLIVTPQTAIQANP